MANHVPIFKWAPFILASCIHARGKPAIISSRNLTLHEISTGPDLMTWSNCSPSSALEKRWSPALFSIPRPERMAAFGSI
jgi:hypothetical protein